MYFWNKREELCCSLNTFYKSIGISKQAVHDIVNRRLKLNEQINYLLPILREIRIDHPTMSLRSMYFKIKPVSLGRDRFEKLCKSLGFSVKTKPRTVPVTTDSRGVTRFDNLIKGNNATGADKIWVSDITYFRVKSTFHYITLVMDQFTREIKGYSVSSRLFTEHTTLPALKMAIKKSKNKKALKGLILHSDGGGQYYDKDFKALTGKYEIQNSMCEYAHENPHAERLNRTIKHCYLYHRKINSLEGLIKEVDRTVTLYNKEKPHKALNHLSPAEYAKQLVN